MMNRGKLEHILAYARQQKQFGSPTCRIPPGDMVEIMERLLAQPVSGGYKLADDTRRMDWLVAHHVTVRKPLRYGSEAMFTAQTITDEEDDYHATKLREQIDAAMLAAAPEGGN
ncbi:TPA: hypothetical protein SLN52_003882 [Serratia marcescens]|nr:hypothetical protein [Serratia marcescens]